MEFDLGFSEGLLPKQLVKYASFAEKYDFRGVWMADGLFSESYFFGRPNPLPELWVTLTSLALGTKRFTIGPCITNPYTRHPVMTAMATVTLSEVSRGRTVLAIGSGDSNGLRPLGIVQKKPAEAMKDATIIIRRLLDGEKFSYTGEVFKVVDAEIEIKVKKRVPMYIGSSGPRILETAGQFADGVMDMLLSVDAIPPFLAHVEKGAKKAGRTLRKIDVGTYMNTSVSANPRKARELVKYRVIYEATFDLLDRNKLRTAGLAELNFDEIKTAYRKGGLEAASNLVPNDLINALTITGTADDCIEKVQAYSDAGVNFIIIGMPLGPKPKEALRIWGEEIIPCFRQ